MISWNRFQAQKKPRSELRTPVNSSFYVLQLKLLAAGEGRRRPDESGHCTRDVFDR
jgi:hypothetical protein